MFDMFLIPQTIPECAEYYYNVSPVWEKLQEVIPSTGIGRNIWHATNGFDMMSSIILRMCAANMPEGTCMSFVYFIGSSNRFIAKATAEGATDYGIYINEEASTHFRGIDYPGAIHLEGAENMLKQSPQHFLKIFTMPNNNRLYIYTNKVLDPSTLYKIAALNLSLTNKKANIKNVIATEFVNALVENNREKAIKILTDFMNSDKITEFEMSELSRILKSTNTNKISQLERRIENNRASIADYENSIAQMATQIRDYNQEIAFLKSTDDSSEHKLFYKYLRKNPYISSFKIKHDGYLELIYRAPIIYFNTTPAEKYLSRGYYTEADKTIIKAILGHKYELWTKCTLRFNTMNFAVGSLSMNHDDDLLNHPHIDRFNCFGNHRQAIQESAEAGDYIGAIEQLSQAVLNLNFYDSCVVDAMLEYIRTKWNTLVTWKCKETGEFLTTAQLVERGDYYEKA